MNKATDIMKEAALLAEKGVKAVADTATEILDGISEEYENLEEDVKKAEKDAKTVQDVYEQYLQKTQNMVNISSEVKDLKSGAEIAPKTTPNDVFNTDKAKKL